MKVVLLSLVFVMSSYNRWSDEITKVTYKNILISKSYDMFEVNLKLEIALKIKSYMLTFNGEKEILNQKR